MFTLLSRHITSCFVRCAPEELRSFRTKGSLEAFFKSSFSTVTGQYGCKSKAKNEKQNEQKALSEC